MANNGSPGILAGVRVLDLSRMLSGPYCTMMLADHGAEVIKIEGEGGDTSRSNGPFRDDDPDHEWAGYFVSLNRGKKSVQLDLKSTAGKVAFRRLANTADVLVENFRPGVMERLGLSYETLAEDNPRLVYAAIRGFGDPRSGESPYASWPSYDVVAQAMGGLIALTGPNPETPTKVGPGIGDVFTGLMMSFGIIAALRNAEATGRGQFVDVGMYDAVLSLCERAVYQHDYNGSVPGPEGNGHPLLAPFGLFPASDGMVALGIVDDAFWRGLARAMGDDKLGGDPRFATKAARRTNATNLNWLVGEWTSRHSKEQLADLLGGVVPFGPVNTVADIAADPHVAARRMIWRIPNPNPGHKDWHVAGNPLHFSGSRAPEPIAPPRLGQHNVDFLTDPPDASTETALDPRALRNAFGAFATGVAVVTTRQSDGVPRGFTVNSFTSVSLDPPLVLVCIAKSAASRDLFASGEHFAVNLLGEEQKTISGLFATQRPDKFDLTGWRPGAKDVPLIDEALASFACSREKLVNAGDHVILVGRVIDYAVREGKPLGYYRGNYFSLGLEQTLVDAAVRSANTVVGAILEQDSQIYLLEDGTTGAISVPATGRDGSTASLDCLIEQFASETFSIEIDFLYAVYQDRRMGVHGIYYHGAAAGPAPANGKFFELDEIPWGRIASPAELSMLKRYATEYQHGSFGIYEGDEVAGRVRELSN
jgi:crotonobetainyl-CoA:carnitine CoA-transferase CaiB-like acyl-CoA transferase/flavin reductase (DIM6/NTAB) family NADH-FMN oxidoreductase RutF